MEQVPSIPEADAWHCSRVLKPPAVMLAEVLIEYPAWAAGITVMASVNINAVDAATVVKSCFIFSSLLFWVSVPIVQRRR
jgi:hypothetical protein